MSPSLWPFQHFSMLSKQVHRGTIADIRKEIEDGTKVAKVVSKPPEVKQPFRSNISNTRSMFEKDNNEANELKNKRNSAEIKKDDEMKIQNGNEGQTPPKPLPRVSRTGSLSEPDENVPKPVARPRTNTVLPPAAPQPGFICSINISGGYKVWPEVFLEQRARFFPRWTPQHGISFLLLCMDGNSKCYLVQ